MHIHPRPSPVPSTLSAGVFPRYPSAVEFPVNLDLDFQPDPLEARRRKESIPDLNFLESSSGEPVGMSRAAVTATPDGIDRGSLFSSRVEYHFTA